MILQRFLRGFVLAGSRPSLISRLPGLIFEAENPRFSCCFVACARSVRTSSEVYKTLHWLTKIEVRAFHRRIKKRRKIETNAVRDSARVRRGLWAGPGRRLERLRLPTWRPRWPTWRPKRPAWLPERLQLASGDRPKSVPARSRSDPERPGAPKSGQNLFFVDFFVFWSVFSLIFPLSDVCFQSV